MKEVVNSFAEFAAIVMILITLALSTAAVAQWGGATNSTDDGGGAPHAAEVAGIGRG